MPAEEPQMDVLHNSLAGRLVDVSLVTEHPLSTAVSREGRQESRVWELSQAESALEFVFKSSEQVPGCNLRPR